MDSGKCCSHVAVARTRHVAQRRGYTSATKLTVLRQLRYLHRTNGNRKNLVRGRNVRLRVGKIDIELRPSRSGGGAGGPGYRESFASRGQHQYRACGSPYGA